MFLQTVIRSSPSRAQHLHDNGRFYTRGRIIRLDELGQTFVVGRIMRL